jgi:hypothetical protein
MATIRKEIQVAVTAASAWAKIRDVGNAAAIFPDVLSASRMEGDVRIVEFKNGMVIREPIVTLDDEVRRFAWSAQGGATTHYNAVLQVFEEGPGCRIVWTSDLLPNEVAGAIDPLMSAGMASLKSSLER